MSKWNALIVGLCASLTSILQPAAAAVISVGPYTVSTMTPFVVPIEISGAVDLDTFTFDLTYDASAFAIDTGCDPFSDMSCDLFTGPITLGTFYGAAIFPPLFNPGFILLDVMGRQTGSLIGVDGAWQDPGPGPSGSGILAFVDFTAISGTQATSPIEVVGSPPVVVPPGGGTVPEPSTVGLLFAALAFATWRRTDSRPVLHRAASFCSSAMSADRLQDGYA